MQTISVLGIRAMMVTDEIVLVESYRHGQNGKMKVFVASRIE
jgi:hypothetical protein